MLTLVAGFKFLCLDRPPPAVETVTVLTRAWI
jgi:hypothetical protein